MQRHGMLAVLLAQVCAGVAGPRPWPRAVQGCLAKERGCCKTPTAGASAVLSVAIVLRPCRYILVRRRIWSSSATVSGTILARRPCSCVCAVTSLPCSSGAATHRASSSSHRTRGTAPISFGKKTSTSSLSTARWCGPSLPPAPTHPPRTRRRTRRRPPSRPSHTNYSVAHPPSHRSPSPPLPARPRHSSGRRPTGESTRIVTRAGVGRSSSPSTQ